MNGTIDYLNKLNPPYTLYVTVKILSVMDMIERELQNEVPSFKEIRKGLKRLVKRYNIVDEMLDGLYKQADRCFHLQMITDDAMVAHKLKDEASHFKELYVLFKNDIEICDAYLDDKKIYLCL